MEKYILSIDQGTTSTRAIIFKKDGSIVSNCALEFKQYYPRPGYVEHDANEIYSKTLMCIKDALDKAYLSFEDIAAIGITNQRETTVLWDKVTGEPVYHAIVWQSIQSKPIIDRLIDKKDIIKAKTGLIMNPYFSASKIRWIFEKYPDIYTRAKNNEIAFGTIDSWLLYKLTGHKVHATDYSNASRTLLFNIHTLSFDDELLDIFDIPKEILPEVKDSSGIFGYLDNKITKCKVPISGIAGDQQAALFGQCCFEKGQIKNTYGTGCFTLMNTGEKAIDSTSGLLTTIAWKIKDKVTYALEGSVFVAGASIQWLRDELQMIKTAAESEDLATQISSTEGVYVVPSFTGLGTPYWDDSCRGAILGLTRGSDKRIIVRATLESIAYQSLDVIDTMKKETKIKLKELSVDGGACMNDYLMQFQSDILNTKIVVPYTIQTTALGACYLAGLGIGFYQDYDEIINERKISKKFYPIMNKDEVKSRKDGWKMAIKAVRCFKVK